MRTNDVKNQLDTPGLAATTADALQKGGVDRKAVERDAGSSKCKPVGWRESTSFFS